MDDDQREPAAASGAAAGTGTGDPVAGRPPRFASLQAPSAPFWVVLIGGVITALVLVIAAPALFVFALGTAIAFFLVPVVDWLQRRGMPRAGAAILIVATMVVLTIVLLLAVTFIIIEQGVAFAQALPTYLDETRAAIMGLPLPAWLADAFLSVGQTIDTAVASLDPGLFIIGFIQGLLGMVGVLFSFMLLPFFLFYLLKDQPRMAGSFYRSVPVPWKRDVSRILTIMSSDIAQYFKAELLVGSIMFLIIALGMFAIGSVMPDAEILVTFALLLGLIAFVMELVPQIGPILSYIPALILSLTVGPETVVVVSIFYFIAFNIEGSILVPTFQGRMISFSGATVLVLITIGFALGGIVGAIVALPVAAIARDVFGLFFERAQDIAGVPPEPRDETGADGSAVPEAHPGPEPRVTAGA